jgi:hypothetical protein
MMNFELKLNLDLAAFRKPKKVEVHVVSIEKAKLNKSQ